MKSIVISDERESMDVFLFDESLLFRASKIKDESGGAVFITDLKFVYSLDERMYAKKSISSLENNLDKVVSIILFLIEYYRDKGYKYLNIGYGYSNNMHELNYNYRTIFKTLGFKIPRTKNSYLTYEYK